MVRELRERRGVRDERVLQAMASVPRHAFVRPHLLAKAYGDFALPTGLEQTISQPYVIARMIELAHIESSHRVLEIGTGSGYQTAILSRLASWVFSMERIAALARQAIERLRALDIENVKITVFDGTVGWSEAAPFDRIVVSAGTSSVPTPLLDQLKDGGTLVVPEGDREHQTLVAYDKRGDSIQRSESESVTFVPLIGRYGWSAEG